MPARNKVQVNVSIDPHYLDLLDTLSNTEGRKKGETVERMLEVYKGSPRHLLDRLRRLNKHELSDLDKAALRDIQDLAAFLLHKVN